MSLSCRLSHSLFSPPTKHALPQHNPRQSFFKPNTSSFSPKPLSSPKFSPKHHANHHIFPQNFDEFDPPNLLPSIVPGSSWWNLPQSLTTDKQTSSSISVIFALRKIWALVFPDRWVVFTAITSLTVAALSEISMPSLLAACIFSAQNGERFMFFRNSQILLMLCLISGISSGLRGCCFKIANTILMKRLRQSLYSAVLFQDISFYHSEAVGNLTSRLGADCQRLSRVIGNDLHLVFRNILQGIGALLNLLMLSQPLALSSLAICFVLSAIFLVYGPYQKKAAGVMQELEAYANEVSLEAFSLVKTVRVYGTEKQELKRYQDSLNKLAFVNLRESTAYGFWNLSFNTLYRSTQVLAVVFGGMSIFLGKFSAEQLMKYILYCEWLIYATWRLVDSCASIQQSVGASERLFQLIDLLPCSQFSFKGVELQQLGGDIEFLNVSFSYPTRIKALVLDHVNMSICANEVIAIVGPIVKLLLRLYEPKEGSGKSTIVKLLLRLYEPKEGEIMVDGYPLKDLDVKWLREQIGYVGQEPHLFHMDVRSNIAYGSVRDVRLEDVKWAAKLAYAHDFISSLPEGYDTLVNNDLLSGGQKQRIAMARAILRNPAILILDEPTSAQDAESEHYIMEVLGVLRKQCKIRTIILIAHKLSTVEKADRIFVIDGGKIAEKGTHTELLQMDGLYSHLATIQGHNLP